MPKKVDRDQRRAEIAKVIEKIVFEDGLEALTVKVIARHMGCSPSVICHYFDNKLDMLVYTHRLARERAEARLLQMFADGLAAVECFEMLLPTDEDRWRDWHTWFAFWGLSPTVTTIEQEWSAATSDANQIFVKIISKAQADGAINPRLDPLDIATDTQTIINGIASLAGQSRADWPAERQIRRFRTLFDKIIA